MLEPLARAFRPQLILVSAGYDPQEGDPLGDLCFSRDRVPVDGRLLVPPGPGGEAAGPLVFLEGGYVPEMMAASIVATLKGLQGEVPPFDPVATADERADVRETLEEVKPYWKGVFLALG